MLEMTGYQQPAAQCRWLDENNYTYTRTARGKPRLTIKQVEAREIHTADEVINQAPNVHRLENFKQGKRNNGQ